MNNQSNYDYRVWYQQMRQRDIRDYLNHYPQQSNNTNDDHQQLRMTNVQFYRNQLVSRPENLTIDQLLDKRGQYAWLERAHGYIQWLFPLREPGMNMMQEPLSPAEIEIMRSDESIQSKIQQAYQLMLDFFGMQLVDNTTGQIDRLPNDNYIDRYDNLNRSSHNYLRITRILKSLGELGFEHYKLPFCLFIWKEMCESTYLPNLNRSARDYWFPVLRVAPENEYMNQLVTSMQYLDDDNIKKLLVYRQSNNLDK